MRCTSSSRNCRALVPDGGIGQMPSYNVSGPCLVLSGEDVFAGVEVGAQGGQGGGLVAGFYGVDDALVLGQDTQQVAVVAARVELHESHEPAQLAQEARDHVQAGARGDGQVTTDTIASPGNTPIHQLSKCCAPVETIKVHNTHGLICTP